MWYLVKVHALVGAFVFSGAGLVILTMFAWEEARALAASRHRIYKRLAIRSLSSGLVGKRQFKMTLPY
jgi:hypothetical protein